MSSRHGTRLDAQHQHTLLTGAGRPQGGDGRGGKRPTGVRTSVTSPTTAHPDPHAHSRHVHPQQSSRAGQRRGPPGVVGFRQRPRHQRIRQVRPALDASAALRLPVDLGHALEVDEVAETERRQVEPGLLTIPCCLDRDSHLCVVRRPTAGVVFPLPQPALAWR